MVVFYPPPIFNENIPLLPSFVLKPYTLIDKDILWIGWSITLYLAVPASDHFQHTDFRRAFWKVQHTRDSCVESVIQIIVGIAVGRAIHHGISKHALQEVVG